MPVGEMGLPQGGFMKTFVRCAMGVVFFLAPGSVSVPRALRAGDAATLGGLPPSASLLVCVERVKQ